jgi:hypothetical protein
MNSFNNSKISNKRKYNQLENSDMAGITSIKDKNGKRHTVNLVKPQLTKVFKNENNSNIISVKNKNPLRISRNYNISRQYSISVKIKNSQINKR